MSVFDLLAMALGLVLTLLVVVGIHELGHYFVGRWLGLKPTRFAIGFGRPILSKTDRHGTTWDLRILPIGGYVKFAGDDNATSLPSGARNQLPGSLLAAGPAITLCVTLLD